MSLGPHPTTLHAPSPRRAQTKRIEGLSGETELRRASGGYWQVWPRPTPESQRALYGEQFYESDKSTYLADMAEERPYWDALWTIRRQMMENALPPTPARRRMLGRFFARPFPALWLGRRGHRTLGPSRALCPRQR
jgi:hypothetical protein